MEISSERVKIAQLLRQRGKTAGQLAREIGVNRSVVYQSMDGLGARRIRVAIAVLVGVRPSVLWPQHIRKTVVDDLDFEALQTKTGS